MPSEPKAPIRGRHLEALRAVAENPGGLRHEAYPTVMPTLRRLGLVVSRPALGPGRKISAWFITHAGREHLAEIDAGKPSVRGRTATGSR